MEYIENHIANLKKRDQRGITLKLQRPPDSPESPTKTPQQLAAAHAELAQTERDTDHGCDSLSRGRGPKLVEISRPEIKQREEQRTETDRLSQQYQAVLNRFKQSLKLSQDTRVDFVNEPELYEQTFL